VVFAIALVMTACGSTSDGAAGDGDAGATIESYIQAYNNDDFDSVMSHFTDESTIVGRPTDADSEAADIYEIRQLHKENLSIGEQYKISNVAVNGDTVTWNSI
jgi:hypothetical protein